MVMNSDIVYIHHYTLAPITTEHSNILYKNIPKCIFFHIYLKKYNFLKSNAFFLNEYLFNLQIYLKKYLLPKSNDIFLNKNLNNLFFKSKINSHSPKFCLSCWCFFYSLFQFSNECLFRICNL